MSCASATLLAPSVMLSENVIKGMLPRLSDGEFLRVMRLVVVVFAAAVLIVALTSNSSIYTLVVNTYSVTLVTAFVPLAAGLFWSRATTQGALCAFAAGLITWVGLELFGSSDSLWHPQLTGFFLAAVGMIVGSLLPQKVGTREA
jgi:Na+/proline symporter